MFYSILYEISIVHLNAIITKVFAFLQDNTIAMLWNVSLSPIEHSLIYLLDSVQDLRLTAPFQIVDCQPKSNVFVTVFFPEVIRELVKTYVKNGKRIRTLVRFKSNIFQTIATECCDNVVSLLGVQLKIVCYTDKTSTTFKQHCVLKITIFFIIGTNEFTHVNILFFIVHQYIYIY